MFLILVIHYLAKQSKKADNIDYSSQFDSEKEFFDRKESWNFPRGSIHHKNTIKVVNGMNDRKSLEYEDFD